MTDQPVTCPICGARAEIIFEFEKDDLNVQICKCPDLECGFIFVEEEDFSFNFGQ